MKKAYLLRAQYLGGFNDDFPYGSPWHRDIKVASNTTLEELNSILLAVINWEDNHLFTFTVRGNIYAWLGYDSFVVDERMFNGSFYSAAIHLGVLNLQEGEIIAHEFDFGDRHKFHFKVLRVDELTGTKHLPLLISMQGWPPPQYPDNTESHYLQQVWLNLDKSVEIPKDQNGKKSSKLRPGDSIPFLKRPFSEQWIVRFVSGTDRKVLEEWRRSKDKREWEKAVVILENWNLEPDKIADKIERPLKVIKKWVETFNWYGLEGLSKPRKKREEKSRRKKMEKRTKSLLEILHQPPSSFGVNRSNWNLQSIVDVFEKEHGESISKSTVSRLITIDEDPGIPGTIAFRNARDKGFKIGKSTVNAFLSKQRGKHLCALHRKIRTQTTKAGLLKCMTAGKSYVDVLANYVREKADSLELALTEEDRATVIKAGQQGSYKRWRQGLAIDMSGLGISGREISMLIGISSNTLRRVMADYQKTGFSVLFENNSKNTETAKQKESHLKANRILEILHDKPSSFGINRTSWTQQLIAQAYKNIYDKSIGRSTVGHLIRKSGYSFRKARRVLTSPDPEYIEKVEALLTIVHSLQEDEDLFFITWDAASWHASTELVNWLDDLNAETLRLGNGPYVEFVPLPISSQFLNVIESVFSSMARAVIHHSDYGSAKEMKTAISKHFVDRNEFFEENPRRAGKKIWEIDFFTNSKTYGPGITENGRA